MAVRFRIRTPGGQELSFASQEMFEDFVRSGDLSPDDLVYDGETGSWSPARTHPTVLEVQYEDESTEEPASGTQASSADAEPRQTPEETAAATDEGRKERDAKAADDGGTGPKAADREGTGEASEKQAAGSESDTTTENPVPDLDDDLGLDLALHEEESAEEAKRKLIEKLEAERQSELDAGGGIRESLSGFMVESGSAELLRTERPGERPPPPSEPPSPPPKAKRPEKRRPRRSTSPALAGRGAGPPRSTPAPDRGSGSGGLGRVVLLVIVLGVLAGGAWVGYQALQADATPTPSPEPPETSEAAVEPDVMPDPDVTPEPDLPAVSAASVVDEAEAAPPTREPLIADTEAAVRERAQERYLASTQAAFRDLRPIPEVWPEGPYLSLPSDHPGVVDVWQHYRTTVREVRADDEARYRGALEAALDDAGLEGEARDARLDAVLAGFEASGPLRAAHYDRVEALATAALQSHNALVEAEGLLIYDPTGSTGPEQGIGRGMSGRDAESQLLLDQVVELLTASLDADGQGPGSPENVREWVWDGFLDAATR